MNKRKKIPTPPPVYLRIFKVWKLSCLPKLTRIVFIEKIKSSKSVQWFSTFYTFSPVENFFKCLVPLLDISGWQPKAMQDILFQTLFIVGCLTITAKRLKYFFFKNIWVNHPVQSLKFEWNICNVFFYLMRMTMNDNELLF